ncbi:MAG: hypothetical protein IPM49_16410 [Flavobacteriales bacterium]|nr:hypothetical protein [Flavobacteriales bacterium]
MLFALFIPGFVQDAIASKDTLHLARNSGGEIKVEVKPGAELDLVLADAMPAESYSVSVERKYVMPSPIDLAPFMTLAAGGGVCPLLSIPFAALDGMEDEAKVAEGMIELRKAVSQVNASPDANCTVALATSTWGKALERTTRAIPGVFVVGEAEEITVTIVRKGTDANGKEKEIKWTYVFSTGQRGSWVITYGFNAIVGSLMPEERYFTQAQDSSFVIKRRTSGSPLTYAPTVIVHWMPRVREPKAVAWSLTAGLGLGNEMPTLTLGGGLIVHHNIALHVGLALHAQDRLNGKYSEGDMVKESLDDTQLHERQFAVNPFFGVSFRFDKSPFEKEKDKKDQ